MSCYEQFHWKPDDIASIPYSEAAYLSIYFEELAAHNYREAKEARDNARTSDYSDHPGIEKRVVVRYADDDDDEYEDE